MIERIRRNWNQTPERDRRDGGQVHDSARRHLDGRRARAIERLRRSLDLAAQRARRRDAGSCPPLPAGVSEPHADRSPRHSNTNDDCDDPVHRRSAIARRLPRRRCAMRGLVVARRAAPRAAAAGAACRRSNRARSATTITGERRRAAPLGRAGLHRPVARRRDAGDREDDQPGAVRRPGLRARVRAASRATSTRRFRPRRRSTTSPFDRWRELNADGVVVGTVQKTGDRHPDRGAAVQRPQPRESAFGKEYSGSAANPRLYAHTISDEMHAQRGAARRRAHQADLRLRSRRRADRGHDREPRRVKEIYIADYDGENQRRVTVGALAEHHADLVARRPLHRLHVVPPRACRTSSSRTSTRARSTS